MFFLAQVFEFSFDLSG